jgi:hypothetical protein
MTFRKKIRILAVSLAVLALLVFSTTVVSDWDCHSAADDTRCPYCHLTHQAPAPDLEISQNVYVLEPVGSLALPDDASPVAAPVLSETAPRAPPAV